MPSLNAFTGIGAGSAIGQMAKANAVDDALCAQARQQERIYMFWSIIQNLDNMQNQLRNLNFVDHSAALDNLMDDLVKQWMKERRRGV